GSDKKYTGSQIVWVGAPLNDLPVFIKAGAIIPMQNVVQTTTDKGNGILYLHVWYGNDGNSFTYYEDDGTTYQYEQGKYYLRNIHFNPQENEILMDPAQGSYPSKFNEVHLILHGFPANESFTMNRQQLKTSGTGEEKSIDFKNINGKI